MPKQDLSQATVYNLWNLTQGLVKAAPPALIPPQACSAVSNLYGLEGKLRPRFGWTEAYADGLPSSNIAVYGLYEHVAFSGTRTLVCMTFNTSTSAVKFYEWTGGSTWTDRTGAAALTGYQVAPYQPTFANFNGELYFTTGNNGLYSFTPGGNISAVTNGTASIAPFDKPKIVLCWNGGRLFTFNSDNASSAGTPAPARVAWSDFLLDNVWQGGASGGSSGYQDLYFGDDASDGIVGALAFDEYILCFKPRSMYAGVATNDSKFFEFAPLTTDIGLTAQNTLRRFQQYALWLGYDNVYMMEGLQKPEPVGDAIRTYLQSRVNSAQLTYSNAWIDPIRQLYHLYLQGGNGYNNALLTFNIRDKSWWEAEIENTNVQPICAYNIYTNPLDITTYCGSQDGNIYKHDSSATADAGTAFETLWESKIFDAHNLVKTPTSPVGVAEMDTMTVQKLAVMAESGTVQVRLKYGPALYQMQTTEWKTLKFSGAASDKYVTFRETARFMQVQFRHTAISTAAQIQGMTLHILPRSGEAGQ